MLTTIFGRGRVRLLVAGSVALLALGVGGLIGAAVASAAGPKLVHFVRPTGNTLIEKGTGAIRVIVQVSHGARLQKVDIDGVDVTRSLRARRRGNYAALLRFSDHLRYGYNDAFVQATGRNGRRAGDHVRFIVARRDDSLLHVTSIRTQTSAGPLLLGLREAGATDLRAALSVADGVSARVYVNDRRANRAFSRERRRLFVHVGAAQGLHYGRNRIQILVHETHPFKRQSHYDMESRTVYIGRQTPIAGAGADHTATQDGFVRLDGRAAKLPPGWTGRSFRWQIVSAPKGSKTRLRGATSSRPTLVPSRPGHYAVRVSVRGTPTSASGSLRAMDAGGSDVSYDTTYLTVMPDTLPDGVRLGTLPLRVDGKSVPGTDNPYTDIDYAVIDRQTLQIKTSGTVPADVDGIGQLSSLVDGYGGSLGDLVAIDWYSFGSDIDAERNAMDTLLQKIGAAKLTADQRGAIQHRTDSEDTVKHGSAVGVAGAPAGSAFVTFAPDYTDRGGGMTGSLRLNGVTHKYDFVFTDPVDFDTETDQTATDFSPAQLTIKVGDKTYTQPNPGGAVSGFHLLYLNADTLDELDQTVFTTNAADGTEQDDAVHRLAIDLNYAVAGQARGVVILQAFGAPHGNNANWDQVAKEIERLGGTREVFDALNALDPPHAQRRCRRSQRPLRVRWPRGVDRARGGGQLFAERSSPAGSKAVLMRARDDGYAPMIASPPKQRRAVADQHRTHSRRQPSAPALPGVYRQRIVHPIDATRPHRRCRTSSAVLR